MFVQLLSIFFAFFAVQVSSPILSILFLMSTFVTSAWILWKLQLEFFSLILIIIYVSGICILFLFIVLTMNLGRIHSFLPLNLRFFLNLFLAIMFLFSIGENVFFLKEGIPITETFFPTFEAGIWTRVQSDSLTTLGFTLYSKYFVVVFLAALILFIVMIGTITLLINLYPEFVGVKQQDILSQTSMNEVHVKVNRFSSKK